MTGLDRDALHTGDLVFSFIGKTQNAISAVTEGFRGARVNHMGVAIRTPLGVFILEAFPPEVRLTHIDVFERRSDDDDKQPRVMAGRLQAQFQHLIAPAIEYGIAQRNIPYDERYLSDEAALYCSELVVDMFKDANGGEAFFTEHPMSFRITETGELHPFWIKYYAYFGMQVPEGQPGSNPGDISKDPRVEIHSIVGSIPGYQG